MTHPFASFRDRTSYLACSLTFLATRSETDGPHVALPSEGLEGHEKRRRSPDSALSAYLLAFFADFGEMTLIGPAFVAACITLLLYGRQRDAFAWALALAVCVVVTVVLKTFVGRFEISIFHHVVRTGAFPSGHAGISLVFYDGLAALLWYGSRLLLLRVLAAALVALQAMIVAAVFLLGWHPFIDIVAGLFLGVACLAAAYWRGIPKPATVGDLTRLAVVVAAVIVAFHGERLDDGKLLDGLLGRARIENSLSLLTAD